MMFAMIAPTACLSPSIATMAAFTVACVLVFTFTVTVLGVKLVIKAFGRHANDHATDALMTDNNNNNDKHLFRKNHQFGTVIDGRSSEVCGDVDFFCGHWAHHRRKGSFNGIDFHAAIHNGFLVMVSSMANNCDLTEEW